MHTLFGPFLFIYAFCLRSLCPLSLYCMHYLDHLVSYTHSAFLFCGLYLCIVRYVAAIIRLFLQLAHFHILCSFFLYLLVVLSYLLYFLPSLTSCSKVRFFNARMRARCYEKRSGGSCARVCVCGDLRVCVCVCDCVRFHKRNRRVR